jgi:uncharacterized protein
MKVQRIEQSVNIAGLEDWGMVGLEGTPPMQVSGVQRVIPGREAVDAGIFQVTPGTYRRAVKGAEIMHFLSGSGRFTPDRETTIPFRAGDTLFFEAQTEGTWEIDETMRKVYVIL